MLKTQPKLNKDPPTNRKKNETKRSDCMIDMCHHLLQGGTKVYYIYKELLGLKC